MLKYFNNGGIQDAQFCGYHEYQRVWMAHSGWQPSSMAAVGEVLRCERERPRNPMDPYAAVVKKEGITVGKSMW